MIRVRSKVGNQLLRLFNLWMTFVVLTKVALLFPHWKISLLALLNYDLYFLVTLLALSIFFEGHYNRFIFLNIAIFAFSYVPGYLTIFMGADYSFGNNFLQYYWWGYRKIFSSIVTCIAIIYIPIDYFYYERKTRFKYVLTLGISLPIALIYYWKFFNNSSYLVTGENYYQIFRGILGLDFLALFVIISYGYLLLKYNKPILGYVNLLMFNFLFFVLIDLVDNFFYYYLHKPLPDLSNVFLIVNLIFFVLVLIHNLNYLSSEFGQFYENVKFSRVKLDIVLLRKKTVIDKWILLIQENFSSSPFRFLALFLMAVTLGAFVYFYPYGYSKVAFFILMILMVIILWYLNLLVKRRINKKITNSKQINNKIV